MFIKMNNEDLQKRFECFCNKNKNAFNTKTKDFVFTFFGHFFNLLITLRLIIDFFLIFVQLKSLPNYHRISLLAGNSRAIREI